MEITILPIKEHEIANFVNRCTEVAKQFGQTQQCREHMRNAIIAELTCLRLQKVIEK